MASSTERSQKFRARQARLKAEEESKELVGDFRAWLQFRHFSTQTTNAYVWRVRRFVRLLAPRGVALSEATISDLRAVWPSVGASYHNGLIEGLRAYYRFLEDRGLHPKGHNPALGFQKVRKPKRLPRPYTEDERVRYLSAALRLGPRYYAMSCLGVYGGLRVSEVAKLAWSDVGDKLRVVGKGNKERLVPVAPALKDALTAWRSACPSGTWLFPPLESANGGLNDGSAPVHACRVWTWHREVLKAAGLYAGEPRRDGFHRLRHTAVTAVYRSSGRDLLTASRFAGHESVTTTAIYALVEDEDVNRAVARMYS